MKNKNKRDLDEVEEKYLSKKTCNGNSKILKSTRELHLEMVGDKVTYVRVY